MASIPDPVPYPALITPIAMSKISQDEVRKVAHLARLELASEEEVALTAQLSSILEYVEQLSELDTQDIPPTTRAIDVSNVTRIDQLQSCPDREAILNCAPDREDDFFKVPQILGDA
jgi:aspartyl-tRNA(Asn)/glutamyl-tRNA(Gln) amidotransferase subunit C